MNFFSHQHIPLWEVPTLLELFIPLQEVPIPLPAVPILLLEVPIHQQVVPIPQQVALIQVVLQLVASTLQVRHKLASLNLVFRKRFQLHLVVYSLFHFSSF